MNQFSTLLNVLIQNEVEFLVVGGVAATVHGSARLTVDVDVVYRRTRENVIKLAESLSPYTPYLREMPPGLPFKWSWQTILNGLNFTLTTSLGPIDLMGEITGGGTYETLAPHSERVSAFGVSFLCLRLGKLIEVKRAAGRPKDLESIAELEAILEEEDRED